jgi:hypothetical protein
MTDQPAPDYADTIEAQMIAEWVSEGMTMVDACRNLSIPLRTIYSRISANPRFAQMMDEARESGYDAIANECQRIADHAADDYFENGKLNKEAVMRSKLRVETRLKLLSKWHPKKYGEKLQVEQKTATVAIPVTDDPIAAQRAYESLMRGGD